MNVYLKDSVFTTRIDTSENWAAANPVLYKGERGIDSTEGKEKVGDGVTAWNDLPWFGGSGSAPAAEIWEPVFSKTFDEDTTANQQWNLTKPCRKIRLRMAVAGSADNSAAGDITVYINSYTSKCFLPNAFRFETATTKGSFAVAEVEITEDMVLVQTNKSNIASNFNAANAMNGQTIWNASGITFNIFRDVEAHGAIEALSFPTNGKTIGSGTQVEILGVAK
nr:MAG TPA: hyaluronidase [Caudoviricetes sp.]